MNLHRIQRTDRDDLFGFDDSETSGSSHGTAKVVSGVSEDGVSGFVDLPSSNESDITLDSLLEQVLLALEFSDLSLWWVNNGLSIGSISHGDGTVLNGSSETGRGIECRDTGTCSSNSFRQGSLRCKLEVDLALEVFGFKELVASDVGSDHLGDLSRMQQETETSFASPGIVTDTGEVVNVASL